MGAFFAGRFLIQPQAASFIDDSALVNTNLDTGINIAIVGQALGGQPNAPLIFTNPTDAAEVLRGGDLLEACVRAYNPSAQIQGARTIVAVRVNPATQATLALKDSLAATVINLTASDYGLHTNNVKVKIEAGTITGKKITVQEDSNFIVQDNIERKSFTIQYVGAGSAATMTITATTLTTSVTGGPGGENLSITFANFTTLQQIVDFIDQTAAYTCVLNDTNPSRSPVSQLDFVTAQDIRTTTYVAHADLQAIVDFFNSAAEPFVDAVKNGAVGTVPVNIGFTFLAGAVEGTINAGAWSNALVTLQQQAIKAFTLLTSDASVHAMGDAHAQLMSGVTGKKERIQIAGGATGEYTSNLSNYTTRALNLNSDRTALTPIGIKDFTIASEDEVVTIAPYLFAAQLLGMVAGAGIGEPITHKFFRARGLETLSGTKTDFTDAEKDTLLTGGLLIPEFVRGRGFRVVQGKTTWLVDSKFSRVEISTRMAADEVARQVRERLEQLIGSKASPTTLAQVVSATESALIQLARPGVEIIVGDDANPAFKNITATLTGDTIQVSFEASPVIPVNFILVTVHAVPFQGTVTAAS